MRPCRGGRRPTAGAAAMVARVGMAFTVATVATIATVASAGAQEPGTGLRGQVVERFWMAPVAGAEVMLLDEDLREVDRVLADAEGWFGFPLPPPGTYILQARLGGAGSAPTDPIPIGRGGGPGEIVLELTSPGATSILECFQEASPYRTGVVLGVVHDREAGVALPGTAVAIRWRAGEGEAETERRTVTDGSGRFHLCGIPAGVEVWVRTEFLDRSAVPLEPFMLDAGAVVRADLPLEIQGIPSAEGMVAELQGDADAGPGVVTGSLTDATTEEPVPGALLRMAGSDHEVESDGRGQFRFEGVEEGVRVLEVEHLAYGVQQAELDVPSGAGVRADLRITPRALQIEGLVVEARQSDFERRTGVRRAYPMRALAGPRLVQLDRQGVTMSTALREVAGAALRINEGQGNSLCVESTRANTGMGAGRQSPSGDGCEMVVVVLDGMEVQSAGHALSTLRLSDLESIEYLSPVEAGFRYGLEASARGALVLWTRGRGPYPRPAGNGGG